MNTQRRPSQEITLTPADLYALLLKAKEGDAEKLLRSKINLTEEQMLAIRRNHADQTRSPAGAPRQLQDAR